MVYTFIWYKSFSSDFWVGMLKAMQLINNMWQAYFIVHFLGGEGASLLMIFNSISSSNGLNYG